ncbi:dentin matrix acidic phosphoprotein 1-like [Ptychodera flava]|uniref:dentin matrix acidic phosphoprotein 1-like n=1 Tax=Ptychodera flava TaxID=63121 RepID=UPI003969C4AD
MKVDETIILDEVSLYNLINNENTQYDTIDEIPSENVAETDVRPQQVNGDLPDKQQNVKAHNTGPTGVAGEYSEVVPESYLLEGGVTQRSSGAGVMDNIIHERQSRSVVGDNSNGNGNRSDKGDETASPDAVRMSNINIQDSHYDIVGESRGNTADTDARARRMNGGDPPDNSESVRDYDKSPTNTANEYSEIGPDSNLLPKEGDIAHGDSGAGFVDNIAYEAQSPSVVGVNSSDNDQVQLSNVNTEESQYDIVGESRGNIVNSDARPQQTNMDLPDNDENVNARDVFSKSADSEYSEIGPDSNPSPNEGDITPRSSDAGFVENVAYEEAQGPAVVGVISRDEDENSVRDEGSPAVEGVAKTDDESKSSSGFVDNVLYEGNEGWTL